MAAVIVPASEHPVHSPLVFDIVDAWSGRSIGGCAYHVVHPVTAHEKFPVNAFEAESRRLARFSDIGHTPGAITIPREDAIPHSP